MNYRDFLQQLIYRLLTPVITALTRCGVTPNMVTFVGFLVNVVAAVLFYMAAPDGSPRPRGFLWGGCVLLFAGLFDMVDGRLARVSGRTSLFGALWDSTLDRYSELCTLLAIAAFAFRCGAECLALCTLAAVVGSLMVSYVRARAEALGAECKVGLMQRPERVVLTAAAAVAYGATGEMLCLTIPIALMAVLANLTAVWRVAHCRKQLQQ